MRYKHIKEFSEKLDAVDAQQRADLSSELGAKLKQIKQNIKQPLDADDPNKKKHTNQVISNIVQYVDSCIPNEFSPEEIKEAKEWLYSQLHSINDLNAHSPNKIRFALRNIFMDRTKHGTLKDYTIDKLINLPGEKFVPIYTTDEGGLSLLISASRRINDQVIMTIMSDTGITKFSLVQGMYDILANYLGQRYKAKVLENKLISKFNIEDGAFLLFRNIRDPGVYINILVDIGNKKIWAGKDVVNSSLLSHRGGSDNIDDNRLRDLIIQNNNNKREENLLTSIDPIINNIQQMMDNDEVANLYDYLGMKDNSKIVSKKERTKMSNHLRAKATRFNRSRPALTSAIFCFGMSVLGSALIYTLKTNDWGELASMYGMQLTMTTVATLIAQSINGFSIKDTVTSTLSAVAITAVGITVTAIVLV